MKPTIIKNDLKQNWNPILNVSVILRLHTFSLLKRPKREKSARRGLLGKVFWSGSHWADALGISTPIGTKISSTGERTPKVTSVQNTARGTQLLQIPHQFENTFTPTMLSFAIIILKICLEMEPFSLIAFAFSLEMGALISSTRSF